MKNRCLQCFAPLESGGVCPKCGFNNAAYRPKQHHLPPGTVLHGHFVIGKALGEGGFGVTYAGFDQKLERRVAIKEYYPNGAVWRDPKQSLTVNCKESESSAELFRFGREKCMQEAKSLATLDDIPAIVRIIEFFEENNTVYIIMEYVEGETLRAYLRRQPKRLTLDQIMTLLSPVTEALEDVHRRGFVHRDVSPDNIMITPKGTAKLLDFGAVKHMSNSDGTMTQNPIVKRGFSPMELYSTEGKIGPWTDVYALAATIFYLLTGAAPDEPAVRFDHDTAAEKLSGVLPPAQAGALLRGLALLRGTRQQSVSELVQELAADVTDESRTIPLDPNEPKKEKLLETIPLDRGEQERAAKNDAIQQAGANKETKLIFEDSMPVQPRVENKPRPAVRQADANRTEYGGFVSGERDNRTVIAQKDETQKPKSGGKKILAIAAAVLACVILVVVLASTAGNKTNSTTTGEQTNEQPQVHNTPAQQKSVNGLISAGSYHTVGLKADGTVVATGLNSSSQCNVSGWKELVAVAAGSAHTVGLKADGTVVATGWNNVGQCDVSGWTDVVAVAAGGYHTVGLKADGTVVATKITDIDYDKGQCDVDGWNNIVAVAAGRYHTVGLKADGTVVATGSNSDGRCDVDGWRDIVAVSAGWEHTVGLKADGTVVATGRNNVGQCDVDGWKDVVAVAAGGFHTVGLKADGTVVATGWNGDGRCDVSGWTDVVAVAAGRGHTVGLKADGTVVATGDNDFGQCDVSGWRNMKLPKDNLK